MSDIIGEVANVTVGTFAGGSQRGRMVQITLVRDEAQLTPMDALRLCALLAEAAGQAAACNRIRGGATEPG